MAIDRSAIFSDILRRNVLRREAHLPLLDVRTTYDGEVEQALWRAHLAQHHAAVREEVLADLRAEHGAGFGGSTGGRWAINALTHTRLRERFRS